MISPGLFLRGNFMHLVSLKPWKSCPQEQKSMQGLGFPAEPCNRDYQHPPGTCKRFDVYIKGLCSEARGTSWTYTGFIEERQDAMYDLVKEKPDPILVAGKVEFN
eukprot:Gb_20391 [translate_table: standard]